MNSAAEIIEREIAKLSGNGENKRIAAECAPVLRQNCRTWDELGTANPPQTRWLILDAYVARIDAQHEPSNPIHAECIQFAREVANRLLHEHGAALADTIPQAKHVISRLLGPVILNVIGASKPKPAIEEAA